jgi:hypothetical protein
MSDGGKGSAPRPIEVPKEEYDRRWEETFGKKEKLDHDLYTDEDKDRPEIICDRNGQVVLGMCKRCGRAESQLDQPCKKGTK